MTVRSQNGWPANNISLTSSRPVVGTNVKLRVVNGPAGDLLLWVAAQFHKRVESINNAGLLNDWGYAERSIRGGVQLSNHASGTAIDLNADHHPLGTAPSKTFSKTQITTIHAILSATGGLVRWGGDYSGRQDPMHFEINNGVTAAQCAARLKQLIGPPTKKDDDMPLSDSDLDKIAKRVWGYINKAAGDKVDMHQKINDLAGETALKVWSYRNRKAGDTGDMHQMMVDAADDNDKGATA